MPGKRLTKQEVLELIPSIVDGEADDEVRTAFFHYMENDEHVRKQYESAERIKKLIRGRCPMAKAPDGFRRRIYELIAAERAAHAGPSRGEPVYDMPCLGSPFSCSKKDSSQIQLRMPGKARSYQTWMYAGVVAVLATALLWAVLYINQSATFPYSIEEYAYRHFISHKGDFIQPTIPAVNLTSAEKTLAVSFNLPITIPLITNTEFKGIVYTDFVPGYKTPLLEYYLPAESQYIYVYAFNIGKLNTYGELFRNQEAVSTCVKPGDFHVLEINGKHIVSWKLNDTWYAAISNHDGYRLAALVQPLNQTLSSRTQ